MADAVKEIIESKNENIENKELKRVLLQIMPELAKRQENIRAELLERLNEEIASQGKIELSIGTVLVDNEKSELLKREGRGIYPYDIGGCLFKKNKLLPEPNNNLCKEFFLNLPYRSIQEIIDKKETYVAYIYGKSFTFNLSICYRFISKENTIIKMARMYEVNEPVIFSPWARKAVNIVLTDDVDDELAAEIAANMDEVDWCLQQNGLEGIMLINKKLLWNIAITEGQKATKIQAPDDSIMSYTYSYNSFPDKNNDLKKENFIYVDSNDIIMSEKKGKEIILHSRKSLHDNGDDSIADNATLISIASIDDALLDFVNNGKGCSSLARIRTKANINWVLKKISHKGFTCEFSIIAKELSKAESVIQRYNKEQEYYKDWEQELYRNMTNRPVCYISISADNEVFIEDFADYVIYNLDYMYPEFKWVGVKK